MNLNPIFSQKKIILGVTGCIAAYKSAEIVRKLKNYGADVWVVMTESAQEFISPLTMRTLSQNPCITQLFDENIPNIPLPHISLSESTDLLVVAPATANIIAKAAYGIADDILSTLLLSCNAPKIFAPAMNTKMWNNPIVQKNINALRKFGIKIIEPIEGKLACGTYGQGKMAEVETILDYIKLSLTKSKDLLGKKILITAGGTREKIDPVRYIGNKSSGKMGFQLALAAFNRGAKVKLISTVKYDNLPDDVEIEYVETASEMLNAVKNNLKDFDVLIMAAAVSDYTVKEYSSSKIKKSEKEIMLSLIPTEDILKSVKDIYKDKKLVGFSLETDDLEKNALEKLRQKNLDLIVLNDPSAFESDTSKVKIFLKSGVVKDLPLLDKYDIANEILDLLFEKN